MIEVLIVAIPLFLMGLAITVASSAILGNFGLDANPAATHFASATGIAFIALSAMAFLARNFDPSQARNALVQIYPCFSFSLLSYRNEAARMLVMPPCSFELSAHYISVIPEIRRD